MKNSTPIVLILVAIALFYTFINPQYQKSKTLRAEAGEYKSVLNDVEELSATRDELSIKYKAIPRAEVEKLEKLLPDHIDTVQLAIDMDTIAAKYGISIDDIKVASAKGDDSTGVIQSSSTVYDTVLVSFSFVSTYPNFQEFIQDVEESVRITDIRSVSFKSTDSGLYEFTVDIETYWLK